MFVCVHGTRDGTRKTAHVYNENGICLYGCFNSILRKQKNEPRIVGVKSGKDIDDDDDDDSRKKNISSSTSRNNENRLWRIQFLVIMLTEAWISSNWRKIMKKNRKSLCENGASIGDNSTRKTNYMLWLTRMENVHDDFRAFFAFFFFLNVVLCVWVCECALWTYLHPQIIACPRKISLNAVASVVQCLICKFHVLFISQCFVLFSGRPVAKW